MNEKYHNSTNDTKSILSLFCLKRLRLCSVLCPAISFLHFHVLHFHVRHFHVLQFHVLQVGPSFSRPAFSAPPSDIVCSINLLTNNEIIVQSMVKGPDRHRVRPSVAYLVSRNTRQHSYRKEDRAMRPIYGCPEKFSESALRTRLLFQKFVMDFCSDQY